ncbi:hypothetical protein HHK36_003753 [Tetracentron sinense]|uniref:Uncharacterized protein n=1 Tax=Tetracentron sinense TaxID=13715 RepID=A0A834ZNU5_TETSI|nr:hypothetical protein HHK36_003753 [Tetracentron sinense]
MRLKELLPNEVTMNTVVWVFKDTEDYGQADRFLKDWCSGCAELDYISIQILMLFPNDQDLFMLVVYHWWFWWKDPLNGGSRNPHPIHGLGTNVGNFSGIPM